MTHEEASASNDPAVALQRLLPGPPKLTLAVAESVTCGRVQAAIGAVSGASAYFLGGITAYTLTGKVRLLGVSQTAAEAVNAISAAVAAEMAVGACRLFGSDLAVATTGYAEADAARGIPQPGAFWAVARSGGGAVTVVRQGYFDGSGLGRRDLQEAVAAEALKGVVDYVRLFRAAEARSHFA